MTDRLMTEETEAFEILPDDAPPAYVAFCASVEIEHMLEKCNLSPVEKAWMEGALHITRQKANG